MPRAAPRAALLLLASSAVARATTYAPNDANIYYNPYVWQVTPAAASTINSAAHVRFLFSGTFLSFSFDTSNMVTPTSEVYWRVDNGPATHSLVLSSVNVTIPANNTRGDVPYHSCELFVKSTTETANRWSAQGASTRVVLTGIVTDGLLAQWFPASANIVRPRGLATTPLRRRARRRSALTRATRARPTRAACFSHCLFASHSMR